MSTTVHTAGFRETLANLARDRGRSPAAVGQTCRGPKTDLDIIHLPNLGSCLYAEGWLASQQAARLCRTPVAISSRAALTEREPVSRIRVRPEFK